MEGRTWWREVQRSKVGRALSCYFCRPGLFFQATHDFNILLTALNTITQGSCMLFNALHCYISASYGPRGGNGNEEIRRAEEEEEIESRGGDEVTGAKS